VTHAGHAVAEVLAAHPDGLVAVVTARPSAIPTRSAPEVLGAVAVGDLRTLVDADPARAGDDVSWHAGPAPAAVGAGEDLAGARSRLPGGAPVLVLVDGRAVALTSW
jgi:hypothetical protein